jgi:hypothetical protein
MIIMVIPLIVLISIPIFLGIAYVSPFDLPDELHEDAISEEPNGNILYFLLLGIWSIFLLRIIFLMRRGRYRLTPRY